MYISLKTGYRVSMNTPAPTAPTPSTDELESTFEDELFQPLTGNDHCDRDPAEQAVAQVMTPTGLLMFCGHHWRENEEKLAKFPHSVPEHEAKPMTWARRQELGAPEQRDAGSAPE